MCHLIQKCKGSSDESFISLTDFVIHVCINRQLRTENNPQLFLLVYKLHDYALNIYYPENCP